MSCDYTEAVETLVVRSEPCPTCHGIGFVGILRGVGWECPMCEGEGVVYTETLEYYDPDFSWILDAIETMAPDTVGCVIFGTGEPPSGAFATTK